MAEETYENFYDYPWAIFTLQEEQYGVAVNHVQTMVATPKVTELPHAPDFVRGAINLRGKVMPLIDLRLKLGMSSYLDTIQEQVDMLHEREKEHRMWLEELESSVREGREFTLATDHNLCKFGQWYNSYQPQSFAEGMFLKKFRIPHERIHHVAIEAREKLDNGQQQEALRIIEQAKQGVLLQMIKLFEQFREMTQKQFNDEITLVLQRDNSMVAIAVDSIITVGKLSRQSIAPLSEAARQDDEDGLVQYTARQGKEENLVFLLEAEKILAEMSS